VKWGVFKCLGRFRRSPNESIDPLLNVMKTIRFTRKISFRIIEQKLSAEELLLTQYQ
jgi:hypothetical protein